MPPSRALPLLALFAACTNTDQPGTPKAGSFADDVARLRRHQTVLLLRDGERRVALCPAYQGRVMTSTAAGDTAAGFGYLNHAVVASRQPQPHVHGYGGEDRFWIGPQGGPHTIFFKPGDPQDFEHWFTPPPLDTEPFETVAHADTAARFRRRMTLANASGTRFTLDVRRTVRLLNQPAVETALGTALPAGVRWVAFESDNELVNASAQPIRRATGTLSIWILGMMKPTARTVAVVPTRRRAVVNEQFDEQLGPLPPRHLRVADRYVLYRADGDFCGKIGLRPDDVARRGGFGWFGSCDSALRTLTLVQYSLPETNAPYVNSSWRRAFDPYRGDAVNVYNDGNLQRRPRPVRTFYELESSSPAPDLPPGGSVRHRHRTFHFVGPAADLDRLSRAALGVGLDEVQRGLPD